MSITLKQYEESLKYLKKKYEKLKIYYTSAESASGTEISTFEQVKLKFIEKSIETIENEIKKRKALLKKVTIANIRNFYDDLKESIDTISDKTDEKKTEWHAHIISVSKSFETAYNNFTNTIDAQNNYKSNLDSLAASFISILGAGTISWLSTTGKLAKSLSYLTKDQSNVFEDITQCMWDKATGHAHILAEKEVVINQENGNQFYYEITLKYIDYFKNIYIELHAEEFAIKECKKKMSQLEVSDDANPKEEYEKYLLFSNKVNVFIYEMEYWLAEKPLAVNYDKLSKDFERSFWSAWLPRLKKESKVIKAEILPNPFDKEFDAWLCNKLCKRLDSLIDLKAIGVGEGGLDYWVSQNDVKYLIDWAKSFNATSKF